MTQCSPTFSARQFLGTRALPPVLKALARRRRAGFAGGLMRAAVEPFGPPGGEGAARILALPKAGFTEDALAVFGDDPRFKLLGLHRGYVKAVYPAFLPPWVDDNNYLSAPAELDSAKTALRDFWARAWWELQRTARADAVVTGNFAYHAEQELATAVEASGVPFVAMHKEALKTPGLAAFFTELYRNRRRPFAGRRILVYNRIERDIQIETGIVPPERVTACGMPRLDRLHRWRRQAAARPEAVVARPRLLFFAFHPKTGLPLIPRKPGAPEGRLERLDRDLEGLSWKRLCHACHQAIARLARENPGIDVVIKGKGGLFEWLDLTGGPDVSAARSPNLRLIVGGDPQELIAEASVVSGFNTTALLEAVAAGKRVVVPHFAEAAEAATAPYVLDLGEAVQRAPSADDLVAMLRAAALSPAPPAAELSAARRDVLEHWVGNPDGEAGARVSAVVLAEISGPKAAE